MPGYFRPAKKWDLLVVHEGRLYCAVELKSQAGSLGNNANNRFEEALGNAVDFIHAHKAGAFRADERPWVGYVFLLAPTSDAIRPVRTPVRHFPVADLHIDASYAERLSTICALMEAEGLYDATCPMLTALEDLDQVPNYLEPHPQLTAERFVSEMVAGVRGRMRRSGAI